MTSSLLPDNFDEHLRDAVKIFWSSRQAPNRRTQGGSRSNVLSGKNMDGFIALTGYVATHCGLPGDSIRTKSLELPGYFRATKKWDVLVIHEKRLLAAFEFKSQVGSFGNNFNNRSEEVVGAATDLLTAHRYQAYSPWNHKSAGTRGSIGRDVEGHGEGDPRPPFLAWLILLEDCDESGRPVGVSEPNYLVFPEFRDASYAERYRLLCEKMMARNLYDRAALLLSQGQGGLATGAHLTLSKATGVKSLFLEFAARTSAALAE